MAKPTSEKPFDKSSEKRSNSPGASSNKDGLPAGDDRRSFAVRMSAGIIGALVGVAPLLAGLRMFVDPLTRRKKKADDGDDSMVRIATLAAMPEIGKVYRFPVITVREDKWNKYPPAPIGAVYLRRISATEDPKAFTSVCPHLGCSVEFQEGQFKCPCHNSEWNNNGERLNPESCPSPRGLDELKVKVRNGEIFVAYQRYRGGIQDKVAE
jgi:menaquinol-cytochrome c reductase iron-sulfur subunit